MNLVLIYFAIKYKGDWDDIYNALSNKERIEHNELITLEKELQKVDYDVITIIDKKYPEKLKQCYKPPFVIWLKGNQELLKNKIIAISGDETSALTNQRIVKSIPDFEKQYTIVTTSFKGVDQKILEVLTKNKIFILANGLDAPYLNSEPKKGDLLITEYPPKTNVKKARFKNRNRIYASLANKLILFSSKKNGGINNAVINFLNMGKDIYCFPGDGSENDGNSELIKQGAYLITDIKDLE